MNCSSCGLFDSIDCVVFSPGSITCARCGAQMSPEQLKEARSFYPWGETFPDRLPDQKRARKSDSADHGA